MGSCGRRTGNGGPKYVSSNDTTDRSSLLTRLCRLDGSISKWGYGVSGWAGVFIGVFALTVAEEAVAALPQSAVPLPESLLEPLVLLVLVYVSLGVAYTYRQRYGGPSCSR